MVRFSFICVIVYERSIRCMYTMCDLCYQLVVYLKLLVHSNTLNTVDAVFIPATMHVYVWGSTVSAVQMRLQAARRV
jgi:hypothetical protein